MEEQETTPAESNSNAGGNRFVVPVIILIVIGIVGVMIVKAVNNKPAPASTTNVLNAKTQQAQLGKSAAKPTTAVKTFTIEAGSYYFKPNVIHVNKGDTVKIVLTNAGGFHSFSLDAFNVKMHAVGSGQTETAQFIADKTGTFQYYCAVANHRQMGQVGQLIVD